MNIQVLQQFSNSCCRLKTTLVTKPWMSATARQIPPNPITIFHNGWILHLLCAAKENSDPEAPKGTEAHMRAVRARAIADVIAALPGTATLG